MDHWDEYYQNLISEVISEPRHAERRRHRQADPCPPADASGARETLNRRNWEIHFSLMYPADAIYFAFEGFCKEHGMDEKDFIIMLRGFTSMPTQTDEEMWDLGKLEAEAAGVRDVIMGTSHMAVHRQTARRFRKPIGRLGDSSRTSSASTATGS